MTVSSTRRLGLYLRSKPSNGGIFQYGLSMLRAVAALKPDFEPVVAYTQLEIREFVQTYDLEAHYIGRSTKFENALGLANSVMVAAGLPVAVSQAVGDRADPLARRLHRLNCGAWLFPAGDPIVYGSTLRSAAAIHDLMHRYEPRFREVGRPAIRWRREFHYRALCEAAERIVVESPLGARHVRESYCVPESRITVIPYAAPDYIQQQSAVVPIDLPALPPRYLYYPAQFWPHKNHLNLARAMRLVADAHVHGMVVLSGGDAGARRAFRQAAETLAVTDRFIELGYVPNEWMPWLYRRSTGLIYPTFFGPTNIPPLEALFCETPMAVSDNYGMREQVHDASLYFDPNNPRSIADAMITLLTRPDVCDDLVMRGRALATTYYSKTFATNIRSLANQMFAPDTSSA